MGLRKNQTETTQGQNDSGLKQPGTLTEGATTTFAGTLFQVLMNQNQNCLLGTRQNDYHSPGPGRLVPNSVTWLLKVFAWKFSLDLLLKLGFICQLHITFYSCVKTSMMILIKIRYADISTGVWICACGTPHATNQSGKNLECQMFK